MIGNNNFYLNESTLKEAVQLYFDSIFKKDKAPKVTGISQDRSAESGNTFTIKTEATEE